VGLGVENMIIANDLKGDVAWEGEVRGEKWQC
jgi:hypothetical protein